MMNCMAEMDRMSFMEKRDSIFAMAAEEKIPLTPHPHARPYLRSLSGAINFFINDPAVTTAGSFVCNELKTLLPYV